MSDPFVGRDIDAIWKMVEQAASGVDLSDVETEAVDWLRNVLGTKRPLQSYAPRTRRRYRKAAREHETATSVNRRDYEAALRRQGKSRQPTDTKNYRATRSKMMRLIDRRNELLPHSIVDIDYVNDYVKVFGNRNVIMLLQTQIRSCEEYLKRNPLPGRKEWDERRWTKSDLPEAEFTIGNTDIMYYYHSVRARI